MPSDAKALSEEERDALIALDHLYAEVDAKYASAIGNKVRVAFDTLRSEAALLRVEEKRLVALCVALRAASRAVVADELDAVIEEIVRRVPPGSKYAKAFDTDKNGPFVEEGGLIAWLIARAIRARSPRPETKE